MSLAHAHDSALVQAQSTTVPSGVPTEAPGTPVKLTIPDGTLNLTGCASPNAFVTIFEDNTPVGTVIANNFGRFSKIIGSQGYGIHKIQAFQEDRFQNISSTAEFVTNLKAHTQNELEVFLPPTVYHDKNPVIIGDYLTFRGFTCPNATVNLNINKNLTLVAKANEFGNWWIIADTSLYALGTHTYTVVAEVNNQLSKESQPYIFRTSKRFQGDTGNLYPSELTIPQITSPKNRALSSTKQLSVSGFGPANTQIELFADDKLVGSTFSNPFGDWSIQMSMFNSQHSLRVRACIDSVCTDLSDVVVVFYSGDIENCQRMIELGSLRFWGLRRNDGVNLDMSLISGQPEFELTLDWGDATIENISLYRLNETSYHHVFKDIGQYNGTLTVKDSRGCSETHYFSVHVTKDFRVIPWIAVTLFALLISLVVALISYAKTQKDDSNFFKRIIARNQLKKPSEPTNNNQNQH